MADISTAARELGEAFSEVEVDLERAVYDALAPHIKVVGAGVKEIEDKVARLNRVTKLVRLLMSTDRIDTTEDSLHELETMLDSGIAAGRFHIALSIEEMEEKEVAVNTTPEPTPEQMVADLPFRVNAATLTPMGRMRVTREVFDTLQLHFERSTCVAHLVVDTANVHETNWMNASLYIQHRRNQLDRALRQVNPARAAVWQPVFTAATFDEA